MVDIKKIIPTPTALAREVIIVLVGVLGAAYIISRFPSVQRFVQNNSVTVTIKDSAGNIIY